VIQDSLQGLSSKRFGDAAQLSQSHSAAHILVGDFHCAHRHLLVQ